MKEYFKNINYRQILFIAILVYLLAWFIRGACNAPFIGEHNRDCLIQKGYLTTLNESNREIENISDWKTHKSEYGFEFKYPPDWTISTDYPSDQPVKVTIASPEALKAMIGCYEGCAFDLYFNYYPNISEEQNVKHNNLTVNNLTDYVYTIPDVIYGPKEIIFAGHKGYEIISTGYSEYYSIFVERNNHVYEITFGISKSKDDLTDIEKTILSTFRFTK